MGRHTLALALTLALGTSALAQSPTCYGEIVIVDGVETCQAVPARDSFDRLLADYEQWRKDSNPFVADRDGDRDALRRLPDVSPEFDARQRVDVDNFALRHAALEDTVLPEARLDYDLLGYVLRESQRLAPFDAARMPMTNDSGFFSLPGSLARQTVFRTPDDYAAYATRLTKVPAQFRAHRANLDRGIETGYTASAAILPGIIDQIRTLAETAPEDQPAYQPFKTFPATFSERDRTRLRDLGAAAMRSSVIPAYRDLLAYMKETYAPAANPGVGLPNTPAMREYYKALVKYHTTLDITPDEVHRIGLSEVARIRREMDAVIRETGFEGDFQQFVEFLRTDPQFYAQTEDELLMRAAWLAKQVDGMMPQYFGTLPRLPYGVMKVPDEIAPNYTTGRYWGGDLEKGKAGNYMVNTYDLSARPLYNLPALTLHEGVPGHHHQIALAQEQDDVPAFRQDLYPTAFGEGWGLYSERLGEEMGFYKTPYERFGRLTYEMWRACRLVVDTGLHWKGWTREQAENCFLENSALSRSNIRSEVDRYISWPGQALGYKIGELKIVELRERAEKELGEAFDIRAFHDAVLEDGGLPLDILEAKILRWIEERKTS